MDASSVSMLWYRRSKPLGKVRRRVQDVRIPSSSCSGIIASRPTLDLSHNESARLAVDSLLSRGLSGYREVLNAEGEVDFLSEQEKIYILENVKDSSTADPVSCDDDDKDLDSLSAGSQSATLHPTESTDSESTVAGLDLSSPKDAKCTDPVQGEPIVKVYFPSDSRAAGMKDLVREFIRKSTMALAIVMDRFSDVELLCDLLEASRKRNVSVHLLLDHLNLNLFISMWKDLKLDGKYFPKLSVRSVDGLTYCAKTGRKLTGQIGESFIITDWTEVLTGSYSFCWLSWQVHRSLAVLLKGSAVTPFHQEFYRLYSSSTPVLGFVTYITMPHTLPLCTSVGAAQSTSRSKSSHTKTMCLTALDEDVQNTETKEETVMLSNVQSEELECSKADTKPPQLCPDPLDQPGALQRASVEKPKQTVGSDCIQHDAQNTAEPPKDQNHIQSQTNVSYVQSPAASLTVTAVADNVRTTEPLHAAPPPHRQHRTVCYQSALKTNSDRRPHSMGPEGLLFQQRSRDTLTKPLVVTAGPNTQRKHWNCSPNFKPKVDFLIEDPSTLRQKQANTGLLFPVTLPRGDTAGLQTKLVPLGTGRQDLPQRHHQPHPQSAPTSDTPGSKSASTATGSRFKASLQSDCRLLSPGAGTKLHLLPHTSQQVKPPPRLTWMTQSHAARPRPGTHHSSFAPTCGTGQQAGWRPFNSSTNAPLGRSKSTTGKTPSRS